MKNIFNKFMQNTGLAKFMLSNYFEIYVMLSNIKIIINYCQISFYKLLPVLYMSSQVHNLTYSVKIALALPMIDIGY